MNMEYKSLLKAESYGSLGGFGIEILVASNRLDDLSHDKIKDAAYAANQLIADAVTETVIALSAEHQEFAKHRRAELAALFDAPIFVETIPNAYSSSAYCKHLPWLVVTTRVGRFTIGWRKRVIQIDWSATVGTEDAETIFAAEDVTKGERYIHAWGLPDARRYITEIIASAERAK